MRISYTFFCSPTEQKLIPCKARGGFIKDSSESEAVSRARWIVRFNDGKKFSFSTDSKGSGIYFTDDTSVNFRKNFSVSCRSRRDARKIIREEMETILASVATKHDWTNREGVAV